MMRLMDLVVPGSGFRPYGARPHRTYTIWEDRLRYGFQFVVQYQTRGGDLKSGACHTLPYCDVERLYRSNRTTVVDEITRVWAALDRVIDDSTSDYMTWAEREAAVVARTARVVCRGYWGDYMELAGE